MKIQSHLAIGSCSLLAAAVIRHWLGTVRCRVEYGDQLVDPVHQDFRGPKIYVFWHENILLPLYLRGHCNIAMLLSRHADANVLDRVARMMGFGVVRGSTFRGGSTALRELSDRAATESLTITPDGPRGPRRRLAMPKSRSSISSSFANDMRLSEVSKTPLGGITLEFRDLLSLFQEIQFESG